MRFRWLLIFSILFDQWCRNYGSCTTFGEDRCKFIQFLTDFSCRSLCSWLLFTKLQWDCCQNRWFLERMTISTRFGLCFSWFLAGQWFFSSPTIIWLRFLDGKVVFYSIWYCTWTPRLKCKYFPYWKVVLHHTISWLCLWFGTHCLTNESS